MTEHPNYELLESIGESTLATVYRGRDLALQRDVAIKVLRDSLRDDPQHAQQLWDAAQFLAGLNDDHVAQVYGLDRERGWLIMELLPGSLAGRLTKGPLPPDLVRSILQQALQGLRALHEQHKLHGAIKPSNLLINERGRVKLGDSAGLTQEGEARRPAGGTKYLAPELINPELGAVGPGVDLYALGLTALELLTGANFDRHFAGVGPDAADPEVGWLRLHGSPGEPVARIRDLVPQAPEDLSRVIERLLAKAVHDRYGSAAEALADLEPRELLPVELPAANLATATPSPATHEPIGQPAAVAVSPRPAVLQPGNLGSWWTTLLGKAKPALPNSPRSARQALERHLRKPWVLYPVCGLIVLAAALVILWPESTKPVAFRITSTPSGARVFINGVENRKKKVTDADFQAKPGTYRVRVELDQYQPSEERVLELRPEDAGHVEEFHLQPLVAQGRSEKNPAEAKPAQNHNVEPPPAPRPPVVVVESDPAGAEIQLDGQLRGKTPQRLTDLAPGTHTLRLSAPGRRTLVESITVRAEEQPPLHFILPLDGPAQDLTNGIAMRLKLITAGKFVMGSPVEEPGRKGDEGPQFDVRISRPFYLGIYEVTQAQYRRVMGNNPSAAPAEKEAEAEYPVENVSWEDAMAFCKRLSELPEEKAAGRRYRLPTEAEWEYACRAGTRTAYSTGNNLLAEQARIAAGRDDRTAQIGSFAPNAWGLYDMHGNVWEWCADSYNRTFYLEAPGKDPYHEGDDNPEIRRVLRGGSFQSDADVCRSAFRLAFRPETRSVSFGFRVVCEVGSDREHLGSETAAPPSPDTKKP